MERFLQTIVKEAGAVALKHFGTAKAAYYKSSRNSDVVTKADLASERVILKRIREKYPEHGIISEESGRYNADREFVWIIDPIDGTLNFSSGISMFAVMICLIRHGEVIMSAIYIPTTKELFFASRGKGAYLNGKRIHCSSTPNVFRSIGSGSATLRGKLLPFLKNLTALAKKEGSDIIYGSLSSVGVNSCYVAAGRKDWVTTLVAALHDFAPVSLILEESGCTVTDTKGKKWTLESDTLVAANPRLHRSLMTLTKNI